MANSKVDFALRPFIADDAPGIAGLIGDWEVIQWLSGPPYPFHAGDAAAFLATLSGATPPTLHAAIVVDGGLAGGIAIDLRSRGYNLGYWLGRPYWGRRIMSRAAALVTADFFAKSQECQLKSGYFSGNVASWSIQRRLGFAAASEGLLFNRPHGKRLPHVETVLTRERYAVLDQVSGPKSSQQ